MDKTGIIIISLCVAALFVWVFEQQKIQTQQAERQQQFLATNVVASTQTPAATPAPAPVTSATPTLFDTNLPENLIVVTNDAERFTFTSRGGGLKQVDLLNVPETVSARWKRVGTNTASGVASLNTRAPLPVLSIIGDTNLVEDGNFTITRLGKGVRAEKLLPDGLRVVKDFSFSSNYLVNATIWLQNTTGKPLALPAQEVVIGTATPMGPDDQQFGYYGGIMWYDGTNNFPINLSYFNPSTSYLGIIARTPKSVFEAGNNNVVWAAAYNQFFVLLAMPKAPVDEVLGIPVTLPPFPNIQESPDTALPRGIQAGLMYPPQTITANSNVEWQITLYAGPKEYRTLANIAEQFQNHADDAMNFGKGYFSFWGVGTFFAKLLLVSMNLLHDVTGLGYGWVIVLFTVLIKVVFWPLTAASTRSMKRMQAQQPEMKSLQQKYKDDAQKLTQKQWELYRKHKVNPLSGCLPMFIQMPVFIGFYTMIRSAFELRGAHFLWVADLTKPDTILMIPGLTFLPFSTPEGWPLNLLPLLMGGAMLWQSHLAPPSPGMDPTQQKMMRWLPAMFVLFLYNYSAGLALYWTVNNLLTILQTKLTRNLKDPAATPELTPRLKSKK